jgi:hypothetical protein
METLEQVLAPWNAVCRNVWCGKYRSAVEVSTHIPAPHITFAAGSRHNLV